jgi:hypothetical protein
MGDTRKIEEIRADLDTAKSRFLEVLRHGDKAISSYDLSMGYDAEYYLCVSCLLANHIKYYNRELKEAQKYGEQISLF